MAESPPFVVFPGAQVESPPSQDLVVFPTNDTLNKSQDILVVNEEPFESPADTIPIDSSCAQTQHSPFTSFMFFRDRPQQDSKNVTQTGTQPDVEDSILTQNYSYPFLHSQNILLSPFRNSQAQSSYEVSSTQIPTPMPPMFPSPPSPQRQSDIRYLPVSHNYHRFSNKSSQSEYSEHETPLESTIPMEEEKDEELLRKEILNDEEEVVEDLLILPSQSLNVSQHSLDCSYPLLEETPLPSQRREVGEKETKLSQNPQEKIDTLSEIDPFEFSSPSLLTPVKKKNKSSTSIFALGPKNLIRAIEVFGIDQAASHSSLSAKVIDNTSQPELSPCDIISPTTIENPLRYVAPIQSFLKNYKEKGLVPKIWDFQLVRHSNFNIFDLI